jgi:hypothetical protein
LGLLELGLLDSDLVAHGNFNDKIQLNISARTAFNTILSDQFKTNTFNKIELTNPFEEQVFFCNNGSITMILVFPLEFSSKNR